MRRHWQYLKYVLRHKWFVLLAGLELRVPIWQLIIHDWHKFTPGEWLPYARTFYAPDGSKQYQPGEAFDRAWNTHQKRGKHHWQYWLLSPDKPRPNWGMQSYDGGMTHCFVGNNKGQIAAWVYQDGVEWMKHDYQLEKALDNDLKNTPIPLEMPDRFRREMLADWMGAGRALGNPDTATWYRQNCENMFLHPNTRVWIEQQLKIISD